MNNERLNAMFEDIDRLTESGSNKEGGSKSPSDPLQYIYEQIQTMDESDLNKIQIMIDAKTAKIMNEKKEKEERLNNMCKGIWS